MNIQPYRLSFGKHKDHTLREIPQGYRDWLVNEKIYVSKPDLEAALIANNDLAPTAPGTPPHIATKRKLSDVSESTVLKPSPKKVLISKEAKRNGTMLNFDGSTYILDFGKNAGKKLREVPSEYIFWLIANGVPEKRRDLADALHVEKMLAVDSRYTPDPAWRAPSFRSSANDSRFYEPMTQAPLWISDYDVARYFGLSGELLSRMGAHLVSDTEIMRSTEFGELMAMVKGPKRWLFQVHACAGKVGSDSVDGTKPYEGHDEAMKQFLGKNQRRETEIMGSLGRGASDNEG
ncbi:MAG: hypothetical protein Q9200_003020 [Gallowayella weberi]